jgi:hypothetical protein
VLGGLLTVAMNLLPRSELEERLQRVEGMLREIHTSHPHLRAFR